METLQVVAAVMVRDGYVLAARRGGAHGFEGGWEFPGGKVEKGETDEEALRRELAEELGLRISLLWHLDDIACDYPDFRLSLHCYVCPLDGAQTPELSEHTELRWLGRGELLDVDWLEADRTLALELGTYWDQIFAESHL